MKCAGGVDNLHAASIYRLSFTLPLNSKQEHKSYDQNRLCTQPIDL
jgi:hypothetical protein